MRPSSLFCSRNTPMVARTPANQAKRANHGTPHEDTLLSGAEGDAHEAATLLLEAAIDPVARAMGYEIVLVEWAGGRGGRIVRIYLDHPSGVSLDDCTRMSRIFSNALDAAEADPETPALAALLALPYTLEVSSPGLDRPLVKLSHFARSVGGRSVVKTKRAIPGGSDDQRTFHGRIVGTAVDPAHADDDRRGMVTLRALDGDILYDIPLADIRRAHLVYEPDSPPRPKGAGSAVSGDDLVDLTAMDADELDADEYDEDDADEDEDVEDGGDEVVEEAEADEDDSPGPRG